MLHLAASRSQSVLLLCPFGHLTYYCLHSVPSLSRLIKVDQSVSVNFAKAKSSAVRALSWSC